MKAAMELNFEEKVGRGIGGELAKLLKGNDKDVNSVLKHLQEQKEVVETEIKKKEKDLSNK